VGEDRADDQGMLGVEAALECLAQLRQLRPQAATGQLGQDVGIGGALESASSIARPLTPRMSVATQSSGAKPFSHQWSF
jgi:hypothetical protein